MAAPIKNLENLLGYLVVKNRVISKNIANVGTENYKREDVVFKDLLNKSTNEVIRTADDRHISLNNSGSADGKTFQVVQDNENNSVSGINNVDIDKEMSELAETTLLYRFATRKIGDYFKSIQGVIKGGAS